MNDFILTAPKLTKERLFEILNKRFEQDEIKKLSDLKDPFVFKDMQKAIDRIEKAINSKEKITLVGDYDVDGVVSSVIVKEFFEYINYPLEIIIPNRFSDGYGINSTILDKIDASVIITVDNGISAIEPALECKKKGIDLIITDHHTCPDILPDCFAIINPKQKDCGFDFGDICGAVVAWYLVAGLKKKLNVEFDMKNSLDLLAIATISDAVPLVSANRTIVKAGLKALENSKRPSVEAFRQKLKKEKFTSEDVGFAIAPKLNAAGRMNSAFEAYEFLMSKNINEATKWLDYLWNLNIQRKEIELQITNYAKNIVDKDDNIIVVWGDEWHEGVIGIVASRLVDLFNLPAIVFSVNEERAKGSARSIGSVDIYALIKEHQDMLINFGGHKQAAGLSIKKEELAKFKKSINESAKKLDKKEFIAASEIIGEMDFDALDCECYDILEQFEPYGICNPKPLFLARDASVVDSRKVGSGKNHIKLVLKSKNECKNAMAFFSDHEILKGQNISFAFALVKNEFRNEINFEFMIKKFF
ncbi:MAG: single-stranded-DNA-specific exonuclease [Campylobacterota bacterium]|nr:single-stranded-DNA-specific exonuclease [Campylobacterota bacterium]